MVYIDKSVFFVKNNKVALELYNMELKFTKLVYDGKNTIILSDTENNEYILENIVKEVRGYLRDKEKIMMMQNEDGVVKEVYFLSVDVDNSMNYKDEYIDKCEEMFEEISNIIGSDDA